jgi:hypothetical protein
MKHGAKRAALGVLLLALGAALAQLEGLGRIGALVMLLGIWLLMLGGEAITTRLRQQRTARVQTQTSSFEGYWIEWERQTSAARLQKAMSLWEGGNNHEQQTKITATPPRSGVR